MPAPKLLSGLPKPVLFGLYGAIGGLIGALAFGELLWWALKPPPPKPAEPPPPEPLLAVSASKDLQIYQGGINKLFVQIARDALNADVKVRVEGLPPGVTAPEVTVPNAKFDKDGRAEVEVELHAAFGASSAPARELRVVATANAGGKVITETTQTRLTTLVSPMPQADIVFVLDVTGSMQNQIDGLKNGIGRFADDLYRAKVDARFACVAFRDLTHKEMSQVLNFKGDAFTADATAFSAEVAKLSAMGGGDDLDESSFEALTEAASLPGYRKAAVRTLVLITDAPPKYAVNMQGQPIEVTIKSLKDTDLLHLVISPADIPMYTQVQQGVKGVGDDKGKIDRGQVFDIDRVAKNPDMMINRLMPDMTRAIVAAAESRRPEAKVEVTKRPEAKPELQRAVKSLQSNEQSAAGSEAKVVLRSGVWTGSIASLVCLMLLGGQHHYLRGTLPSAGGVLAGLGGGLLVGLLGGAAGQGLFLLADTDNTVVDVLFRVMGWTILGSLAGAGLSLFVPNLKLAYGLAGGAVGGAVGAIGYFIAGYVAGKVFGDAAGSVLGRLAGGLVLGLFIGLMVAVVEAAFRRAWLEVRYGPREVVTVNLGAEPVKVGGDARVCTVWARGAPEVALRYFIRNGQVVCTDVPSRSEEVVADGDTREAGNVTVVVRTGSGTAPAAPAPRRTAPPPVPKAKPAPAAPDKPPLLELGNDDDDDMMPLPVSASPPPTPAPAPPARPAAAPPRPPVPTATRPPAPAAPARPATPLAAPAAKPAARDPDACPTCGRKNPGRPGSRYCMLCDNTY